MHADATAESFVLDLVALEDCPGDADGCPRFAPFTLHVGCPSRLSGLSLEDAIAAWAAQADVVTMTVGQAAGRLWLCLSADDLHLVLQLSADDGLLPGN
jgi:hypothetical protein